MRVALFQTHKYEKDYFYELAKKNNIEITFLEPRLNSQTAILAKDHDAVCSFVNDKIDKETLDILNSINIKLIALRSAGFNHVDIEYASSLNIPIVRVPYYSPSAIAEHTACLLLSLNRKVHKAHMRVQSLNFSLDGLVGFDLEGKTVGVIGTGAIGTKFVKIMNGFGCKVLAFDLNKSKELENYCQYVELEELVKSSDIISLHIPLSKDTHHLLDHDMLEKTKKGVILLNTSRGALIDTKALIEGLKSSHIGGAGLDVYEEEDSIFFQDLSDQILQDDVLARLLSFPNVLTTSHQAFLTKEALFQIAQTTIDNIVNYIGHGKLSNQVKL
ncbi:2-hydroxyacid dehydrogenase [Halobacteriovorax sp. HLS]|uniref:2-hydroxyacid dehydrogenase n=1 Tax=Halobacteriovorax sp. HLS TaxID=2234000 RepID=UPI000FD8C3C1